jgi:hypothetical protein
MLCISKNLNSILHQVSAGKHETAYIGQTEQDVTDSNTTSGSKETHQNSSTLDMKTIATYGRLSPLDILKQIYKFENKTELISQ